MSKMFIGQFFDTEEGAIARIKEMWKEYGDQRKYCIVYGKNGCIVVGESALKDAGIIPRKEQPKYTKRNLSEDTLLV